MDFGGNWCTDCHVLDLIERLDANVDIAAHYQVPLTKGVPAIAVLDEHGKLLYSQKTGEFEAMRQM